MGKYQSWNGAGAHVSEDGLAGGCGPFVETELLCRTSLLQAGLRHLLAGTCFRVVGAPPELCIVDATGPVAPALELMRETKANNPAARIVAVAEQLDRSVAQSAVEAGVDSFCLATSGRNVLIGTLELTMLGERILPGSLVRSLISDASASSPNASTESLPEHHIPDPRVHKLSPRETVILQSLMGGDPNKIIARKLDITEATIKVHVKAILRKIGVANRTQAAMWASGNLREAGPSASDQEALRLS